MPHPRFTVFRVESTDVCDYAGKGKTEDRKSGMANLLYELLVEVPTDLRDVIHEISDPDDQDDITLQETGQSDTEANDMKPTDVMYYYYSEWAHREESFWKMCLQLFLVGVTINLIPFTKLDFINLDNMLPSWLFPIIGLIIAQIFLVVGKSYAAQLKAIEGTYWRITNALPVKYRHDDIKTFNHGLSNRPPSYLMLLVMYIALVAMSLASLLVCIIP